MWLISSSRFVLKPFGWIFCFLGYKSELLADFEEAAGWSRPHSHTSHTDLKTCCFRKEKVEHLEERGNAHWGLKRGLKLFGFGLDNPLYLWIQDPVFFFVLFCFSHSGATFIHTVEINEEHYRLYDFGEKLVQSWTSFFFRDRDIEQLCGLKVERGNIVQFRNISLSVELRLYWRGCSPSSDCLSCSISGLEPLWYLFTYNFSILWASIFMHMNANFSSFWRALV